MELFPPGKGCLNPPFIVSKQLFVEVKHIFIISPIHQIVLKEGIFLGLLCLKFLLRLCRKLYGVKENSFKHSLFCCS